MTSGDPRLSLLEEIDAPLITVHGPPGVGTSHLARHAFPDHAWFAADDATVEELRAHPGPVVWDGVDPRVAAAAYGPELAPVVLATTGRTRCPDERAVAVGPLPTERLAELLASDGPSVPGLAERCLGRPGLVARAHELYTLLGRLPEPGDWLRLGPVPGRRSPRQAAARQLDRGGAAEALFPYLAAFHGRFLLTDLEALLEVDPLPPLATALDAGLVLGDPHGGFVVAPLVRAMLAERADASAVRQRMLEQLGEACPPAVRALEQEGSTPAMAHRFHDLLAAATARVPGWSAALWLATLNRPTEVPRRILVDAQRHPQADALVARSLARHLRATGAIEEAERLLGGLDDPGARRELGALVHRTRRLDEAEALYRADAHEGRRSEALREANLAAVAHDRGDLDAAIHGYTHALRALSAQGDDRAAGLIASNLGALHAERGEHPMARSAFGQAVRTLEAAGEPRLWSIAMGNLAWLDARTGRPDRALRLLHRALHDGAPDERTAATLWMRAGAVHSSLGALEEAHIAFDTVDAVLLGSEDRFAVALAELFRGFLDAAEGRRLEALAAIEQGRKPPLDTSDDARTATAWLEALLRRRPGQSLVVGGEGRSVRTPDGATHTVSSGAARRILHGLADRWSPHGVGLDLDGLFALGWPGERAVAAAQHNRVHVALSALRKAGLKPYIVRDDTGHLLDPAVPVLRSE